MTEKGKCITIQGLPEYVIDNENFRKGEWYELRVPFLRNDSSITVNDDQISIYKFNQTLGDFVFFGNLGWIESDR